MGHLVILRIVPVQPIHVFRIDNETSLFIFVQEVMNGNYKNVALNFFMCPKREELVQNITNLYTQDLLFAA